jgi:anhydro-N-acetylmuramic acid kinase
MTDYFIGLMSGTSMDAIDAVLVDLSRSMPNLIQTHSHPVTNEIRAELIQLSQGRCRKEMSALGKLDIQMAELFSDAVLELLNKAGVRKSQVRAIGSHGQTVFHSPDSDPPFTIQIGDPSTISIRTGIKTVANFRQADMAAGGQGAPLTPVFHEAVFQNPKFNRVVLNIGGIANITVLPAARGRDTSGFDTGPGNILMDAWIQKQLKNQFDQNGNWAASGKVDRDLLQKFFRDPYFTDMPPKSTGREKFNLNWLEKILKRQKKRFIKKNVQATLCELTASSIATAIQDYAAETEEVIVCGGGVHNMALMFRLQSMLAPIAVRSSEDYGVSPDWVEAIAFAWLAKRTLEGKPGNLPSVTGASHTVVLGGIYTQTE